MHSLLFGVIFFGAGAVGIFTGLMMSIREEVPSPSNIASLLQIKNIEIYQMYGKMEILVYSKCVNILYLLVTLPGLSRRISSLVGLCGMIGSWGSLSLVTFFVGCLRFL
jgi:hypothetical protein